MAKQLPEQSELSQLEVFHVHSGHPVDLGGRYSTEGSD